MFSSPAVAGDDLYVASCSGRLYAFDRATGEVTWVHDTAEDSRDAQFHGEPWVIDDLLVVGADTHPAARLYALDREDGSVRWSLPFAGGVMADVVGRGEIAYVVTASAEVLFVDVRTGEVLWRLDEAPESARGARSVDPELVDDTLLVAWRGGVVDAVDTTGERRWRTDLGSALSVNAGAVDGAGGFTVGTVDGHLVRLSVDDGSVLARRDLGGTPYGDLVFAPEADDGGCLVVLAAADDDHAVACVTPDLSSERWRLRIADEWSTPRPLVHKGTVLVGKKDHLAALDLSDGSVVWQREVPGQPRGLGVSGGHLYVGLMNGRMLALPWGSGDVP